MDMQAIIILGSYTIIALREGLVVVIKPIKKETIQPMRWFFLILIVLWLFIAMALPVTAFVLTKNFLSFTLFDTFAPPIYIVIRIVGECKKKVAKLTSESERKTLSYCREKSVESSRTSKKY